ncbi:hypothetical protein [uncultured Methanobrevibacter sp.]|uniref:hypothetical protein n=1 Tax=uncultured Methanobrevibacter sp. TaxID=253161 RepID=UPI0025D6D18A|nr:hypothetical protein [uncultured Methanobrevibacter sp.]
MEKNQKLIIGALIVIIALIALIGTVMLMNVEKTEIIIPDEYTLESNKSGVLTYKNNLSNGYKLEIKEDTNSKGIKKENMYGSIMKCTVNGTDYIITCYNPVDKTKEVTPYNYGLYDVSDIKAHPGVKPVECVGSDSITFPSIFTQTNNPYDLKTLNNMNKTGNLNATSIQQYFPPTYMDAADLLNQRDQEYVVNRYLG